MSELNKDRLIAKLDEWFETVYSYGNLEDEQAYQQIRHLIESQAQPSEEWIEEKAEELREKTGFSWANRPKNYVMTLKEAKGFIRNLSNKQAK